MKNSEQETEPLPAAYARRHDFIERRLAPSLREHIEGFLKGTPRIDRITTRAKAVDRFLAKAANLKDGQPKYAEPLSQIQDQLGARVVVFYKSDVADVEAMIKKHIRAIEYKDLVPESEAEFSYFGRHLVLVTPNDIVPDEADRADVPAFFELQIKTLFQHAWAEANHDLGYKSRGQELTSDEKRRIAFASAQAWGADEMFESLFCSRKDAQETL